MKVENSITIASSDNDIAIIGMSCRFPGNVRNPVEFWNFLLAGGDGIVDVPADRWENAAYYDADKERLGKMYVNRGGFIHAIDQFDPQFFGISPAEAPHLDPQHRWLLELTYEAFENAGLKAGELKGSDTAVYIGQFMHDYEQLQLDAWSHKMMTTHSATGPSMTLTANRISYAFDLTGPSVTLDTACSSSLVALDMACKVLQNGDCGLAVVGGVNILLRPELTMSICKAQMLSPDCRCKSFDVSANGYVRSEGAGIILVKRLKDAERDGDNILAIIKATGVNQDGQTIGITVPNGASQKKLLLQSLTRAKVAPVEIQYAEAHGTGTSVGDPIEVNALGEVLGKTESRTTPCVIGSVKSNIGHMEAAAGVAGLIKTVLAMNAGIIPRNINFNKLNPAIDPEALDIQIADRQLPWPHTGGRSRKAIVNSFGFGGTNANVVLEQAQLRDVAGVDQKPVVNGHTKLLLISSKTEKGLRDQADKYLKYFQSGDCPALHDVCYTAAVKREHHKYRLAVNGADEQAMMQGLEDFTGNKPGTTHVHAASRGGLNNRIAFVFSGMGPQWFGMGRELYQTEPVFKAMMDRCDGALRRYADWSLLEKLYRSEDTAEIHATYVAQPAIFAVQLALTELLKSRGIRPSYIVGHSAGEVAAAYAAGVLSFDDAVKVIFHRSRLQHTTEGMGKMLAVGITEEMLRPYLAGVESKVSIAAINSDEALTLAGDVDVLVSIERQLEEKGLFARFLNVGVPYHSPAMDQLRTPLIESLRGITVNTPDTPLYSTVTAQLTREGDWGLEYWADNVREPVLFKATIDKIAGEGADAFLEIAPHPVLSSSVQKNLEKAGRKSVVASTLKREQNDVVMLNNALASLHVAGIPVDWQRLYPNKGRLVYLPNYAWQHAAYWSESEEVQQVRLKNLKHRGGFSEPVHPLLGGKLNSPSPIWQKTLDLNEQPYLIDHQVDGDIVYPGAAYVETALAVAGLNGDACHVTLEDIEFKRAMFLYKDKPVTIECKTDERNHRFQISATDAQTGQWDVFSQGVISDIGKRPSGRCLSLQELKNRFSRKYEKDDFYAHCRRLGLSYQARFQSVQTAWFADMESLVEVVLPDSLAGTADAYHLHPVLLDGAFQGLFPTITRGYLPVRIRELHYYRKPDNRFFCYLNTTYKDAFRITGDLTLFDTDGAILVEITGCELKTIQTQNVNPEDSLLYDFNWQQEALHADASATEPGRWIIFADAQGAGARLAVDLERRSQTVCLIEQGDTFRQTGENRYTVAVESAADIVAIIEPYASSCRGVIYMWGLDSTAAETDDGDWMLTACYRTATMPMLLAQALDQVHWQQRLDVFLISQSAWMMQSDTTIPQPVQGALWGFGRVFAAEHPEYRVSMVDLAEETGDMTISALGDDLVHPGYEQEIALRSSGRYINRLRRLTDAELNRYARFEIELIGNRPFQLVRQSASATGGQPSLKTFSLPEAEAHEIVLRVDYAGVNQRDMESILDQNAAIEAGNTDEPESSRGFECAGTVISVGADVRQFATGDRVIAFARQGLSSVACADALTAVKIPDALSSEQAVGIPAAFLTAHYSLNYLARLQEDQTVLIHEATDDIGLAAVQLAQLRRARIFATAGTEEKRTYLNKLGLENVFDSTDFEYSRQIAERLKRKGRGIDVVLNVLPGQFINKTLELVNPFGCFIELGRHAFNLGVSQLENLIERNISYHSVNAADLVNRRTALSGRLLGEIMELFNSGVLSPLPVKSFAVNKIDEALSALRDTTSVHKIALKFDVPRLRVMQGVESEIVRPQRSYLVTGGLGGLGLEIMNWLAEQGAQSIVLTGRRQPAEDAQRKIDAVRGTGVEVVTMQADVSSAQDMAWVLERIGKELYPLAGIIHSAGVLDDATIAQQTAGKFSKVLSPKVKGAWNLHRLTRDIELDFFVCFSSIAAIVGWAGQSNYAAANAFMDTLAMHRRALGKPALSINWGPWSGSGMAASLDARDIQRMNDAGMHALSPEQGLNAMSKLMMHRVPQAGVFDLDWSLIARQYPDPAAKTLFRDFISARETDVESDLVAVLKAAPVNRRESILEERVSALLADVLGIDNPENIDRDGNVFEYGMNSLMSMDFKNRLQNALKFKLPATLVSKHPSVTAMVRHVVESGFNEMLAGTATAEDDILMWDPSEPDTVTNCEINGGLPFTISLLEWFKQGLIRTFNFGFLAEFDDDKFDLKALETSLKILFTHHDGCRVQIFEENGEMTQTIVPLADDFHIDEYDFRGLGYEEGAARMLAQNERYQNSQALVKGNPLFKVAHYLLDDDRPHRFLLLFHHYIADGLSLKMFISDLISVYSKVFNKQPVTLHPKRDSLIDWTKRQHRFAQAEAVAQLPYWESVIEKSRLCRLPTDFKVSREGRGEDYTIKLVTVGRVDYERLAGFCSENNVEITDVAAYAVTRAFSKLTLADSLWIDLVIHARTNVFDDMDGSEIFGMLAECSPLLFELDRKLSLVDQLKAIKAQRTGLPNSGLSLKAMAYINQDPDIRKKITINDEPQVLLNFDLRKYEINEAKEWGALAKETSHDPMPPPVKDDYPREFYIIGALNDQDDLLIIFWYHGNSFNEKTVTALTGDIRSIFISVANPEVLELERS